MPLQIRRGTNAEREALIPSNGLVVGELLYVTDTQQVYIGTGNSGEHQGLAVTGYTNENAVDAAATALVAGSHTNISFTYGSTQDNAGRIDATVDLTNYSGTITADAFKGSLFGDDTTLLVNAVDGTFNLNGSINSDVVSNADGAYDIGSTDFKFKDLYLSQSIHIAGSVLSVESGALVFGRFDGDFEGSLFLNNSTRIIDGEQGNITTNGTITAGDLLINSNKIISTAGAPSNGDRADSPLYFGDATTPTTIYQNSENNFGIFVGLSDGLDNSGFEFRTSRGTLETPLASAPGDVALYLEGKSHDGTDFVTSGFFGIGADPAGTISTGHVPGLFAAVVLDASNNLVSMTFNSSGVLNVPVFKATGYATGSLPSTPEEGFMVFDSTTKEFKGWNGTAWVVLG